jgi:nucleolar protein 15
MRGFFGQFGEVSKLRLSRNKKTGRSRHFAFIEFADRRVASVVAETMDNYMLCNKLLVCKVVDANKLHENTWVGANKKFQKVPWRSIARKKHNQPRTATQQRRRQEKLIKKEARKRETLREMGIDYDFDGCESHAQRCDVVPRSLTITGCSQMPTRCRSSLNVPLSIEA